MNEEADRTQPDGNPEPDPEPDPEPGPGPEAGQDAEPDWDDNAHIRALLAELGAGPNGEPMPAEVAARLDDTLARLVAERETVPAEAAAETRGAPYSDPGSEHDRDPGPHLAASGDVVPLRRHWLPRLAAAAAAVVVLGAGGVAATNLGLFDNDPLVTADGTRTDSDAGGESAAEGSPDSGNGSTPPSAGAGAREGQTALADLPQVDGSSFGQDVTVLLRGDLLVTPEQPEGPETGPETGPDGSEDPGAPRRLAESLAPWGCLGPEVRDGAVRNPVRYEGLLAVLVVHPGKDGDRLVEAWTCAGDRKLATATLSP